MEDIIKRIYRLEIYKKIIHILNFLSSLIGIILVFIFQEHCFCIFTIFILLMILIQVIDINIDYQIKDWKQFKKKVE